jgi:radical SAM superfamily enzyme YgiQ (UPF0313 family)
VVSEIGELNSKYIFFVDDNLFANKKSLLRLLEALSSLNVRWSCQISLDVAQDDRLMKLLEKSGCQAGIIGFESFHPNNLRQMNKPWNLAQQDYGTAIEKLYAHGIMIYGTFVFGYDEDTPDSFEQCLDFALRRKFFLASFNPLTPFPGTPLYTRLKQEDRLIDDPWWLAKTYQYGQATFHPEKMSADDLAQGCFRARKIFTAYTSILQRSLNTKTNARTWRNVLLYFVANYINRKEIYKKQGAYLGGNYSA